VADLLIRAVPDRFHEPAREAEPAMADAGKEIVMSTRARLVFGWALVGIPLAYGVYETLIKASSLFTG
jgi:orotate phosphoribosyltransferase